MHQLTVNIRPAVKGDLVIINQIIKAAVMAWDLPERVKRLSLPSYCYNEMDFSDQDILVAVNHNGNILGIAALEPADTASSPPGKSALLLHGIYVDPLHQHQGIGRQLFNHARKAVAKQQFDGLLVKAQQDASGFFNSLGMDRLRVEDTSNQYANRFWKPAS